MRIKPKARILIAILVLMFLPLLVSAQQLPNPLANQTQNSGVATVIDIVFYAFFGFATLIGLLAFGFFVFSAFRMIVASGSEEQITKAKSGITWSILGFAVAILSFSIIAATSDLFGGTGRNELSDPNRLLPPIQDSGFVEIFVRMIQIFLGLSFATAALILVYAGIRMVGSAGNEEQLTKAKGLIRWAIIGLVATALSFAILAGVNRAISSF